MHEFYSGLLMHSPAWHKLGEVRDEWPGREEAMEICGHNFDVIERDLWLPEPRPIATSLGDWYEKMTADPNMDPLALEGGYHLDSDGIFRTHKVTGFKALVKSMPGDPSDGHILHVANETYGVVPNSIGWDIIYAFLGEGAQLETAVTLRMGAVCSLLAYLPEPYTVSGDDSPILPFVNVSWTHDGSGAVKARSTSIRIVCMNTQSAAEAQASALGREFTFRHSTNVLENIEEAKKALSGVRESHQKFIELAEEVLVPLEITPEQRENFTQRFIPLPLSAVERTDQRVRNIETAREAIRSLFVPRSDDDPRRGRSIPEAHKLTGYGLWLAGTEYLDHMRPHRGRATRFNRSIMRDDTTKAKLKDLIIEVASE